MVPVFKTTLVLCALVAVAASIAIAQQNASITGTSLDALLDKREKKLTTIVDSMRQAHEAGRVSFESMMQADLDLISARLETAETQQERVELLNERVGQMKKFERQMQAAVEAARATRIELWRVEVERLDAEIALHRERHAE